MEALVRFLVTSVLFVPSSALAAGGEIVQCTGLERVDTIAGMPHDATRTFANDKIRLWHIDTYGEPVCCSSHLVIIAPDPNDEITERQCVRLSDRGSIGFQWIDLKGITSSYSSSKGLLLSVPVERYNDGITGVNDIINVRINQATGLIRLE